MIWFLCRHRTMYRERRELYGVLVPHYVCESCGHAVPVINRSPDEYREMAAAGRVVALTAKTVAPTTAAERARVMADILR